MTHPTHTTSDHDDLTTDTDETAAAGDAGQDDTTDDENESGAETFSRTYVERLRRESAGYRERAQQADQRAQQLHTALVEATGRLADPTDLEFDAAHLVSRVINSFD
jgi:hypothetical protein